MEAPESTLSGFHSKFARILGIFGVLALPRVCHEITEVWGSAMAIYKQILLFDLLLALISIAAAVGLMRDASWGRILAVTVGGAWLVSAVTWGIFLLPEAALYWKI